jgi:hypothetical protein
MAPLAEVDEGERGPYAHIWHSLSHFWSSVHEEPLPSDPQWQEPLTQRWAEVQVCEPVPLELPPPAPPLESPHPAREARERATVVSARARVFRIMVRSFRRWGPPRGRAVELDAAAKASAPSGLSPTLGVANERPVTRGYTAARVVGSPA